MDKTGYNLTQGIFTNHLEFAHWYATWWALRIMDVIENYDPDFIYTDGNSTQPFTGYLSGSGYKCDAMQRVLAHYFNRTLERRGTLDTFGIVKFNPYNRGVVNTFESNYPSAIKTDQPWIGEVPVGDWFYNTGFNYDPGHGHPLSAGVRLARRRRRHLHRAQARRLARPRQRDPAPGGWQLDEHQRRGHLRQSRVDHIWRRQQQFAHRESR